MKNSKVPVTKIADVLETHEQIDLFGDDMYDEKASAYDFYDINDRRLCLWGHKPVHARLGLSWPYGLVSSRHISDDDATDEFSADRLCFCSRCKKIFCAHFFKAEDVKKYVVSIDEFQVKTYTVCTCSICKVRLWTSESCWRQASDEAYKLIAEEWLNIKGTDYYTARLGSGYHCELPMYTSRLLALRGLDYARCEVRKLLSAKDIGVIVNGY